MHYNYIIVGQGLAGSILAWFLEQANQSVYLIDNQHHKASSSVAAGIMNPITGRRFVKSWKFEELYPVARQTYRAIEQQLEIALLHEHNILRVLFSNGEENDWLNRTMQEEYKAYIVEPADAGNLDAIMQPYLAVSELTNSSRLDLPRLIQAFAKYFDTKGSLLSEQIDYDQLRIENEAVFYKGISAQKIIFCEGQQAQYNPYFNYLPFVLAKGEVLIVKIPDYQSTKMLKHRIFIVPIGNDLYWIGATNEWPAFFDTEEPTEANKSTLLDKLHAAIHCPFEIVDHKAAVRPTVKDRRPFLGLHPEFPQLAIFNGLGTKGASLAPYWAKHMVEYLVEGKALDKEVDIARHK